MVTPPSFYTADFYSSNHLLLGSRQVQCMVDEQLGKCKGIQIKLIINALIS